MDIEWALFTVAGEAETTKGDGGDNMNEEQIVEAFVHAVLPLFFVLLPVIAIPWQETTRW